MKLPIFFCTLLFSVFCMHHCIAQKNYIQSLEEPSTWVTHTLDHMNKKERVSQLFFIRVLSNQNNDYIDSIGKVIKENHIGGLIFFQGGPVRQAQQTNKYQESANIPLLIAMDAEWGLGMRLDSTISYPYQMALGAIQNNDLIKRMGVLVGQDFKRMGMQFNFAPDVDINNNPKNPVINYRSFGENKMNVMQKGLAYMQGMQEEKILTSLKHFPGHGDTDVDSHYGLPKINYSKERLMQLEIYPFQELIKKGASGVMIAHLNIPSLDSTLNTPSTLSRPIVTGLLKKELGFKGLIVTDAMEMKAVSKSYPPGVADLKAVQAGNDIIELSENVHLGIKTVLKEARRNPELMKQIDESVKKILMAKYWSGDSKFNNIEIKGLLNELNNGSRKQLIMELADASMTLIKGKEALASLRNERRTAIISISADGKAIPFQQDLKVVFNAQIINIKSNEMDAMSLNTLLGGLQKFQQIILAIKDDRKRPAINLPLSSLTKDFIRKVALLNTHIAFFANPYCIAEIPGIENAKSILIGYQNEDFMQHAAAKVFAKKQYALGKLPVTINK